jgi:hypothetical protein
MPVEAGRIVIDCLAMGLIRRNKSLPVQVQRREAGPEQEVVEIPGRPGVSPAPGPGQPHVTQNNIYISTPAVQAAAPAPAPPPTEIHHHTTVHHVVRTRARERGLSFFGVAGLVLGGLAWAALYVPSAGIFVHPLALAGLASAGFGLLVAILFGQSGQGVPFLGLLVAGAAWGMWFHNGGGHLQPEIDKLKGLINQVTQPGKTSPAQPSEPSNPPVKPTAPGADRP